jgi:transcriptional regulator with XRE-family HTH domain
MDSRIGSSLRAARTRAGLSREALAYHSGVSWSAITQIESGRRKDVRSSSLAALANALGVSVDHLIGTAAAAAPPQLFKHRVLAYGSAEDFAAATIPFFEAGIAAGDCLLAVTNPPNTLLLRDALGARAEHVEFADWAEWYQSPTHALRRYQAFVKQHVDSGAHWIRVVAEAAWAGVTANDMSTWNRYESLINLVFASSPATIMCAYDERAFSRDVLAEAHRTHPVVVDGIAETVSSQYCAPEQFLLGTDLG